MCSTFTATAVTSVRSDTSRCRYVTPHAKLYGSSLFLTFCAVPTETTAVISNSGKLGSATDIAVAVLAVQLPVQTVCCHSLVASKLYLRNSSFDCMLCCSISTMVALQHKAHTVLRYAMFKCSVCALRYEYGASDCLVCPTGLLNRMLSWRGFLVTTRLSYAFYLVQIRVFFYFVGKNRGSKSFDIFHLVSIEWFQSQISLLLYWHVS